MGRGGATSDGAATMDQVTALSLCLVFYIKWQNVESLPDADLVLNANVFQFSLSCLGCRAAHSPGAQQCRETRSCQALAGTNSTVVYATGAVVGNMLTPTEALATLPPEVNRRRFDHAYQRRFQASRYRPSR